MAFRDNNTTPEVRDRLAEAWSKYFGLKVTAETILCNGCTAPDRASDNYPSPTCPISPCVQEHGIENCAACTDYPCDKIEELMRVCDQVKTQFQDSVSPDEYSQFIAPYDARATLSQIRNEAAEPPHASPAKTSPDEGQEKTYPSLRQAIGLMAMVFGLQVAMGIVYGIFAAMLGDVVPPPNDPALLGAINAVAFAFVLSLAFRKTGRPFREVFSLYRFPLRCVAPLAVLCIGLSIVLSDISNLFSYFVPLPEALARIFKGLESGGLVQRVPPGPAPVSSGLRRGPAARLGLFEDPVTLGLRPGPCLL